MEDYIIMKNGFKSFVVIYFIILIRCKSAKTM